MIKNIKIVAICLFLLSGAVPAAGTKQITSKRFKVLAKGDVTIFYDNVRMTQDGERITCDMLKSFEKEDRVEGEGNVRYTGSFEGKAVEITGTKVEYDAALRRCVIIGSVHMKVTRAGESDMELVCGRAQIDAVKGKIFMHDSVRLEYGQMTARSERAYYSGKEGELVMTGNPDIYNEEETVKRTFLADEATFSTTAGSRSQAKVTLFGNVRADIIPK